MKKLFVLLFVSMLFISVNLKAQHTIDSTEFTGIPSVE